MHDIKSCLNHVLIIIRLLPLPAASLLWSWWWRPPQPQTGSRAMAGGKASSRSASTTTPRCRFPSAWRPRQDVASPEEPVSDQIAINVDNNDDPWPGYIRGCAALVVIGLLFDFFGTFLTGLGLRSTDPNKKYKYYRVAIYALVVSRKIFLKIASSIIIIN